MALTPLLLNKVLAEPFLAGSQLWPYSFMKCVPKSEKFDWLKTKQRGNIWWALFGFRSKIKGLGRKKIRVFWALVGFRFKIKGMDRKRIRFLVLEKYLRNRIGNGFVWSFFS